jgi:hypothetical protein
MEGEVIMLEFARRGGGCGESQVRCQSECSSSPVTSASKSQLLTFVPACLIPLLSILLQSGEEGDLQLSHTSVILSVLLLQLSLYILFCVISGFGREVDKNWVLLVYYGASSSNFLLTFRDNLSDSTSGLSNPKEYRLRLQSSDIQKISSPSSGFNNPKLFQSHLQCSTIQKDFGPNFRIQQSKRISAQTSAFTISKGFLLHLQDSTIQKDFGPIFRVQQSKIIWILES